MVGSLKKTIKLSSKLNTMKKLLFVISIYLLVTSSGLKGQVWSDNFDDNSLSTFWVLENGHDATYTLTEKESVLKIDYHRVGSSESQWHQFNLNFRTNPLELTSSKKISVKIKSDKVLEIVMKPDYGADGSDWLKTTVAGTNTWAEYTFDMTAKNKLEAVWIYIEGGSLTSNSATVYFDDFQIGPTIKGDLLEAINVAEQLNTNSPGGTGEGQFPIEAKTAYTIAISSAREIYDNPASTEESYNIAIKELQNEMAVFESSVNATISLSIVDTKATKATKYLFQNLSFLSKTSVLFGMHDATSYGINEGGSSWGDDGTGSKSDPKVLVGSHPAVFSLDFYNVVEGGEFAKIQNLCKQAYNEGGIITMCWHQNRIDGSGDSWKVSPSILGTMLPGGVNHSKYLAKLDIIANFSNTLRNEKGQAIPFIFRLYHEQDGAWFWWGKGNCSIADYNALWKFTVEYLRDSKNVHNILYAFSPDGNQHNSKAQYLAIYPGDLYVDIFGLDFYFGVGDQNEINKLSDRLSYIADYATEKNKIAALTESGDRLGWGANGAPDALKIPQWYTRCILGALKTNGALNKISYFATWRNASPVHHFVPYPGHQAVPDFQAFYDDPLTMFLNDLPNVYTAPLQTGIERQIKSNVKSNVEVFQEE
jgi:mannan endo-1,4-beta-mannosidase